MTAQWDPARFIPLIIVVTIFLLSSWRALEECLAYADLKNEKDSVTLHSYNCIQRGGRGAGYFVSYRFGAKGTVYEHTQRISRNSYQRLKTKSEITVIYLENNPEISRLGGGDA